MIPKQKAESTEVSREMVLADEHIARLAYEKWVSRGCPPSDGKDDWFAARAELEQNDPAVVDRSVRDRGSR